ncbi:hypothetical protein [Streptococcus equi]|uniref:hypothetical protein n=1 Tax=Streptococcus equi TaxID=1336 RepID=UPI00203593C1|nr:hypothetical protein [Streptococcus equi]
MSPRLPQLSLSNHRQAHSYGAGAASHAAVDDNTQRAVQAGMVMLAAAGLATVKLKKGSKKR